MKDDGRSYAVYRMYNAEGELLYVGASGSIGSRIQNHSYTREWFSSVSFIKLEHFSTLQEAARREREVIDSESPKRNVRKGPSATPRRVVGQDRVARPGGPQSP